MRLRAAAPLLASASVALAQTFQRLGTCPELGCIFPPDQLDFLPGQLFDIRLEVHAPVNGTEAVADGVPDEDFTFCIEAANSGHCTDASRFFEKSEPALEKWNFTYYEDLFAKDADAPIAVNVASKAYRAVSLANPGEYIARLKYYNGSETTALWTVRDYSPERKAKNVILFIGDGMTQSMITAARLIAHKSINGKYQTLMQMDQMEALGHQMTHSIDSFITDSANSATALYTGKKSSVNALNVFADSSEDDLDDPKFETIAELFKRKIGGALGIVSTAFIADATPAALCAHTRLRGNYQAVVTTFLRNTSTLTPDLEWPTGCQGADVILGGGAEQFIAGEGSPEGLDYYEEFQNDGYDVVYTKEELERHDGDGEGKLLGIFSVGVMAKWLDRQVYPDNLKGLANSPNGDGSDALDQPGLKDMTLKAIDLLSKRSQALDDKGFFLMSEAASIDKMMHVLDYDRALGELLELDDTIKATIAHLKEIGEYEDTLIVVTADHGHGFDVYGGADTKYLSQAPTSREKRSAVGVYEQSGLSGYTVAKGVSPTNNTLAIGAQGPGFPVTWDPRWVYAAGTVTAPDHREGFRVNQEDQPDGILLNGSLPTLEGQGVHSLTDVSVFANGPGHESFRGVYNSVDIFFKIADALGLGQEVVESIDRLKVEL